MTIPYTIISKKYSAVHDEKTNSISTSLLNLLKLKPGATRTVIRFTIIKELVYQAFNIQDFFSNVKRKPPIRSIVHSSLFSSASMMKLRIQLINYWWLLICCTVGCILT